MKRIVQFITISLVVVASIQCTKDPGPGPGSDSFNFVSLTALEDTIIVNESTLVTAEAEGSNLTFTWEKDLGILLGSGSTVTFNACCPGDHTITCTVSNGEKSESKSVMIFGRF